ncbi:hypothetical protein QF032_008051 [Streptomyces achromogenes]|uniref:Uncharacterized protein n=1 Tax=Streptomyces achromogenes TaxID=67255 RepID=A0ABU0PRN0_STRAH|nr:hypothetical protein [Streptomyces achromogenes]MDQ0688991.1 hypothetical protein [Streptomyces achromogenes]MDQ0828168.1 hypothetical protein [Streptomyces achromogenes]MDQ0836207.1 hypothetical protein [Streptomyces achromogenes]
MLTGREPEVAGPRRPDPLSELGLNVVAEKGVGGQVFLREQKHLAQVPVLVPDAQVVHTPAVRSVLRTVAHAAGVGAVVCLYGDAGQGKTVALQYALSQLPHPARVAQARRTCREGLGVFLARAGQSAVLAVVQHGVRRVPVLDDLEPAVDLPAQAGLAR